MKDGIGIGKITLRSFPGKENRLHIDLFMTEGTDSVTALDYFTHEFEAKEVLTRDQ